MRFAKHRTTKAAQALTDAENEAVEARAVFDEALEDANFRARRSAV